MNRIRVCATAATVLVGALSVGLGQAAPPAAPSIEVISIAASPGSFEAGSTVTFTVQIRNLGTRRTQAGTAYLDIFKGDGLAPADHLWGVTTDVLRLEPGATTVVDFVWRSELRGALRPRVWTVPTDGASRFTVRAVVAEMGSDHARTKVARFERRCTYSRRESLADAPHTALADLKRLVRSTPR